MTDPVRPEGVPELLRGELGSPIGEEVLRGTSRSDGAPDDSSHGLVELEGQLGDEAFPPHNAVGVLPDLVQVDTERKAEEADDAEDQRDRGIVVPVPLGQLDVDAVDERAVLGRDMSGSLGACGAVCVCRSTGLRALETLPQSLSRLPR
jgi:hypothetical protein